MTQNARFSTLQSALGQDPTNVFIDIQGARELATDMLSDKDRQMYESEFRPLLNPLTFLGGGVRSDGNGDVYGRFLLGINGSA